MQARRIELMIAVLSLVGTLTACGGEVAGNGVTGSSASPSTSVNISFIDTTTPGQSVQSTWIIGPDTTTTSPATTTYVCGTFGCAADSYAVCSTDSANPCPNSPGVACHCVPIADGGTETSDSGGDAAAVPDGGLGDATSVVGDASDGSALDAVAADSAIIDALVDIDEQ
jgi:hypothetical protein